MDYSRLYRYRPDNDEPEQEETEINEELAEESPVDGQSRFIRFKLLMFVFISSLLVILYVVNVIKVKSLLVKETKLEKQLDKLDDRNQILRAKINQLESPERITKIAKEKFNMIEPETLPKVLPAEK